MKEKFIDRLFLFLEKQGGVYQVAEKMDMSPQNFYNMKRRNSLPNLTMVYSLKETYPDLDIEWLLFGVKSDTGESAEIQKLKEKLAFTEHLLKNASGWKDPVIPGKSEGATNHPQVDREGASQLLTKSVRKNTRESNRVLLNNTWRFSTPN